MGQIVFAAATVHAPQLFTYPPSEDKAQLDADIAAMRELGKNLDEIKPDAVLVIGSDHLETFFLSAVPTFAVVGGEKSKAAFARKSYALPIHGFTEEILNSLVAEGFDLTYSQDAELGHAFAAVYEWVIEGRSIPVIPVFVNTTCLRCLRPAVARSLAPPSAMPFCGRRTRSRSSPVAACRTIRAPGNIRSRPSILTGGPSRTWSAATTTRCWS